MSNTEPKENDLRIWWIPQIPMNNPFYVSVKNIKEAILVDKTLVRYDMFQFENNIKPDYSNAGGLEIYNDNEWQDWEDENGNDFSELRRS